MDRLQIVVSPFAKIVVDANCPKDMVVLVPTTGDFVCVFRGEEAIYLPKKRLQGIYEEALREFFREEYGLEYPVRKEWTE